jgi:predicted nucleic acid-binding protein
MDEHTAEFLARVHAENTTAPIRYADNNGAFVESVLEILFGDSVPIVPDANVFRGNIAHMCRRGKRPVLLNGANSGTFRLFCAQHVLEEVAEHSERWASDCGIPYDVYSDCWSRHFLPAIRLVSTAELRRLLSLEERHRIDALHAIDPDDVPSATLALALGAFYVTEDADARFAVYGKEAKAAERNNWLDPLMCAGNAGELHKLVAIASAAPVAGIAGAWRLGRWLYEQSPWALAAAVGVALFSATRIKKETYHATGRAVGEGFMRFSDGVMLPYNENVQRFRAMLPDPPSDEELLADIDRDSVLMRTCLYRLARSRKSPMAVRDLANELPEVGVSTNVQRVGKMLHNNGCFFEPYRGLWQVGCAIVTASA